MTTLALLKPNDPWINPIAKAHFDRWGTLTTKNSEAEYADLLRQAAYNSQTKNQLPLTLVANNNDKLLGSVNLLTGELDSHNHLTPWLAHLYVFPEARNQGIAQQLINELKTIAATHDYKTLYLYATGTMPDYYQSLGWTIQDQVGTHDRIITILKHAI